MSTPLLEAAEQQGRSLPIPTDVAFMSVIEKASANPDFDANKLEKMLEMYERIMARNAEMSFNSAFAEMQSDMPTIMENGRIKIGNEVRSKYALFEDINDTVKPILKQHGFAITFKTKSVDGAITVTGILMHKDGHREDTEMTLQADTSGSKNAVQGIGSSVSYAKRYVLTALLNITTRGEDDDGQAGGAKTITQDQVLSLQALMTEIGVDKQAFLAYMKVGNLSLIPAAKYADAVIALEKKRKGPKQEKGGK
jgi:hypothetical protein